MAIVTVELSATVAVRVWLNFKFISSREAKCRHDYEKGRSLGLEPVTYLSALPWHASASLPVLVEFCSTFISTSDNQSAYEYVN